MGTAPTPFGDEPIQAIPLAPPPLDHVIAQIKFPAVLSVAQEAVAGDFQARLRDRYPTASSDIEVVVTMPSDAPAPAATQTRIWRFRSEEGNWTVSLGTEFVALQTSRYEGLDDFLERLGELLEATAAVASPSAATRLGVRFIQRLAGDDLAELPRLIRPEVLGVVDVATAPATLEAVRSQSHYAIDDTLIGAKWGVVPPGATYEPSLIEPSDESWWFFDIDVFSDSEQPFVSNDLVERTREFAHRQYRFFRWAVEPEFLLRFGADPELVRAAVEGLAQ